MFGKQLVPAGKSTALKTQENGPATVVVAGTPLPAALQEGIKDLIAAFQAGAGGVSDAERTRTLKIYRKALDGFPEAVAAYALNWLLMHNPRNPFPPSPQDVHEMCRKVESAWASRVLAYFFERVPWGQKFSFADMGSAALPHGGAPGQPDCLIPEALIARYVMDRLPVLFEAFGAPRARIADWAIADLDRIPDQYWPEGLKAWGRELIQDRIDADERRERHKAFMDAMDPQVRKAFHDERRLSMVRGEHLSNDELLAAAERRIAEQKLADERSSRARAEHDARERAEAAARQAEKERQRAADEKQRSEGNAKLDQWLALPETDRPALDDPYLMDLLRLRRIRSGGSASSSLANSAIVRGY